MIHALPGMGADRRMFPAPWSSLPEFVAHDWVPHSGERSLEEVARAMSEAAGIRDGDSLVGASLGGMVACEITKIRRIQDLWLIGSALCKEEVNGLLAAVHPLASVAPFDCLRVLAGKLPLEIAQAFAGAEASFVRAMCSAFFRWEGVCVTAARLFRIHGKHDLVIPPPEKADLLLDGGHLISMTHAEECVAFVGAKQAKEERPLSGAGKASGAA